MSQPTKTLALEDFLVRAIKVQTSAVLAISSALRLLSEKGYLPKPKLIGYGNDQVLECLIHIHDVKITRIWELKIEVTSRCVRYEKGENLTSRDLWEDSYLGVWHNPSFSEFYDLCHRLLDNPNESIETKNALMKYLDQLKDLNQFVQPAIRHQTF